MYLINYFKCAFFMLFIFQTSWCSKRSGQYNRNDEFAGRKCGINDIAVQLDNVLSRFQCGIACLNENACLSFFYQKETKQCYGCSTGYGVNNNPKVPTENLTGSAYYAGYRYLGCVNDWPPLFDVIMSSPYMTTELCVQTCAADRNRYALTEATQWCFCGNVLKRHDPIPEDQCYQGCVGDNAQICGGQRAGSLYTMGS